MKKKTIIFLVSGNGGTLSFLFNAIKKLGLENKYEIIKVISDRECGAIDFARGSGIPNIVLKYNRNNTKNLYDQISFTVKPDFVITNIHKILCHEIISIPQVKFVNLHYSLLPSFPGLIGMRTIKEAKQKNVKFIGSTTHIVTEIVDAGPIICQSSYPVNWKESSMQQIEQVIFESACFCLLNTLLLQKSKVYNEYKNVSYNPGLSFNPEVFDQHFWLRLEEPKIFTTEKF